MNAVINTRRDFLKNMAMGAASLALPGCTGGSCRPYLPSDIPSYLHGYEELYAKNPRQAAVQWFRDARFGLFMHYGLYSLLGRHEWVQLHEKISVREYEKLKDRFTAAKFDADFITELALEARMKYINITTRHHDSFCLFKTSQTDFNSVNSPAGRDLVGELAQQCRKKGLGLFLYYSHGRDWRHPHAPNNDNWGGNARPKYKKTEPSYKYGREHDLQKYVDFMTAQITELLTNYGPIAGIWLDGLGVPLRGDSAKFQPQKLYDLIHRLQPQVLLSYKQGLLGTEDFFAPEFDGKGVKFGKDKPLEVCNTLQPKGWGYGKVDDGKHKSAETVMTLLTRAAQQRANLLLNTGPLPDGSIHPEDIKTLRGVGQRIGWHGFPAL